MHRPTRPTLLVLTTYPLVDPKHGGQIRAKNLVEKFRRHGWQVEAIAFVDEDSNEFKGPKDKVFRKRDELYNSFYGEHILFINDLQISKYVLKDDVFEDFINSVPNNLDAIHVEQPWLWPLATAYRSKVNNRCVLIYGSQNIEGNLKIDILKSLTGQQYSRSFEKIYREIDDLEKRASREADIVSAVSSSDLDTIRKWAADAELILAPNGVEPLSPRDEDLKKWADKLGDLRFLLYAASAHPPNFTNFSELLGGSLGCFPPSTKLVVVGSVTEHIYHQCNQGPFSSVNLSRLELLFQVSNEDLAAIKSLCHGFFLPIPFGGGTNLKTAEALQSGKFVVGTKEAFRGFENYAMLPGVHVASNPKELHGAVRYVMGTNRAPERDKRIANELGWENCFERLFQSVDSAIKEKRSDYLG